MDIFSEIKIFDALGLLKSKIEQLEFQIDVLTKRVVYLEAKNP